MVVLLRLSRLLEAVPRGSRSCGKILVLEGDQLSLAVIALLWEVVDFSTTLRRFEPGTGVRRQRVLRGRRGRSRRNRRRRRPTALAVGFRPANPVTGDTYRDHHLSSTTTPQSSARFRGGPDDDSSYRRFLRVLSLSTEGSSRFPHIHGRFNTLFEEVIPWRPRRRPACRSTHQP